MLRDTVLSVILMLVLLALLAGSVILLTRGFIDLVRERRRESLKEPVSAQPETAQVASAQPDSEADTKDVERAA